jgi:hypothetical protein
MANLKVMLNGREIDLTNAVPLKLRDWKALEKAGITVEKVTSGNVEAMVALFYHILHKSDSSVTLDEVEDLSLDDTVVLALIECMNQVRVDRPFSTPSTSLPQSMDGPSAI